MLQYFSESCKLAHRASRPKRVVGYLKKLSRKRCQMIVKKIVKKSLKNCQKIGLVKKEAL